jgi:acetyltransferase-like isoleucine patch superfamily enzyme
MSNALLHPGSPETSSVLKNIVLEENTFVGLMSLVQGGVTLGKGSAVATTSLCKESLEPGQKLLGKMLMKAPPAEELPSEPPSEMISGNLLFFLAQVYEASAVLVLRFVVLGGYILGVTAVVATCMTAWGIVPMALILALAIFAIQFCLGVVYMLFITFLFHPRREVNLPMTSVRALGWMSYLQALYLSQQYTLTLINGSWMAALAHKLLGADTPLDAQFYSVSIRDQCLLTLGHNAVIDRNAYMVGHSGQPDWSLRFCGSALGDNAVVHPKGIILDGQRLGKGATLDFYSHSHIESSMPENTFYRGNPATADPNTCVDALNAALRQQAS